MAARVYIWCTFCAEPVVKESRVYIRSILMSSKFRINVPSLLFFDLKSHGSITLEQTVICGIQQSILRFVLID